MDFKAALAQKIAETEEIIYSFLPKEEGPQQEIIEAMAYSLKAGGKRLRPILMWETYKMFGGDGAIIKPFMAAIEMVHTYSLVHDDLPAMDNDEYRRGKKSTHAQFGEAMGILAGDALLNYAFETIVSAQEVQSLLNKNTASLSQENNTVPTLANVVRALQKFSFHAGIYGMIGGQVVDVTNENKAISMDTLMFIHEHKTAALIKLSMGVGAILAGADKETVAQVENIAKNIGLAFQIEDDILDVTSTQEVLGKPIGSDADNQKTTYISLVGLEQAKKDAKELSLRAVSDFDALPAKNPFLRELISSLIGRDH